jgi:hypothetical protein
VPPRDPDGRLPIARRDALRAVGSAGAALALANLASCSRKRPAAKVRGDASCSAFEAEIDTQVRMAARVYKASVLEAALALKSKNRTEGKADCPMPVIVYNNVVVFDRPEEDGGGLNFGQDFIRALLSFGLGRCGRTFEMCSGPGYIGYSLLANGYCQSLTLADINPRAAQSARHTALVNGISHLVNVYVSDNLKQIPDSEKWDLVVGNPPHFREPSGYNRLLGDDLGWVLHRDFYLSVAKFMKPGGHIVLVENGTGSAVSDFAPMIAQGGGTLVAAHDATTLTGKPTGYYYVVSRW